MSKVEETGIDDSFSKAFEPIVQLPLVKVQTGEENEELLYKWFYFIKYLYYSK